jgi:hypothetical protein
MIQEYEEIVSMKKQYLNIGKIFGDNREKSARQSKDIRNSLRSRGKLIQRCEHVGLNVHIRNAHFGSNRRAGPSSSAAII